MHCEGFSGAIRVGARILFLSFCDLDAALYHPDTKEWELLTEFRRDFDTLPGIDADRVFWTGAQLVGWLSGNSGTELRPDPQLWSNHDSRLSR